MKNLFVCLEALGLQVFFHTNCWYKEALTMQSCGSMFNDCFDIKGVDGDIIF